MHVTIHAFIHAIIHTLTYIIFLPITGYTPFYAEEPVVTCRKILRWAHFLEVPDRIVSTVSSDCIDFLLCLITDSNKRYSNILFCLLFLILFFLLFSFFNTFFCLWYYAHNGVLFFQVILVISYLVLSCAPSLVMLMYIYTNNYIYHTVLLLPSFILLFTHTIPLLTPILILTP